MQDTMSLLIATTILAVGGLGLYMYKTSDIQQDDGDDYDEDNFKLFGLNNLWNSNNDVSDSENEEIEYVEPKVKGRGGKTKRNKRSVGTKRRH